LCGIDSIAEAMRPAKYSRILAEFHTLPGSHSAWPKIKMPAHKTARTTQEQQSLASGAVAWGIRIKIIRQEKHHGSCR
jgi:hypothetical protein